MGWHAVRILDSRAKAVTALASEVRAPLSVAIIGAGIGGLALGIGLRKQNVPCKIYEAGPRFDAVGVGHWDGSECVGGDGAHGQGFFHGCMMVGNAYPEKLHEQFEILSAKQGFGAGNVVMASRVLPGEWFLEERYSEEVDAKCCNTYVYRNICPIGEAERMIGSLVENAKWYMREGRGCVMYPISKGEEVNIVVFIKDENPCWESRITVQVSREEMLSDLDSFDQRLMTLLDVSSPSFSWGITTPNLKDGPYSIIQIPRSTTTAVFVSSGFQRLPQVLVRQRALEQGLEDALILSKLLGLVTSPDQLEIAFQVAQFHPPTTGPGCGPRENLQTSPTKGCPLIWFYDLGADVQAAEDRFKELTTKD
ncbi:hypothetical protein PAAG_11614 [Paracoccidioides lutzii Pb01]|uniref:Uncharacterized protein n=1 Tax=Paracoccidioides lutzii (strain ATCC MYA-826 / Pb01) TaxID=502779 RepID=A0A0A2V1G9_PARBA|nr:hypothetical protein PAAG_11614 [Paracoccidioides lutzii Pb01]KGQ01631.1 hypothetical protein PAAG_11614 [Paracoccidioides lutzii Pb01]